eukprot:SM000015S01212  [mRNA]  locus=s15:540275:544148:- [translate_table: standard]
MAAAPAAAEEAALLGAGGGVALRPAGDAEVDAATGDVLRPVDVVEATSAPAQASGPVVLMLFTLAIGALSVVLSVYHSHASWAFKAADKPPVSHLATADGPSPFPANLSLPLHIDVDGLQQWIDELSLFSEHAAPSVTRQVYSKEDVVARRYIKSLMEDAGLKVREDAVGNIFGRWEGADKTAPAISTGSHIDAIPHAGKYDGVLGVLGPIEAFRALRRSGFQPKRSLEVIMFTSEEPTRFGLGCLGSRVMAGQVGFSDILKGAVDSNGVSFADAATEAGYASPLQGLKSAVIAKGAYHAFVELHIEQGPFLEAEGISIGIVTAIAAPASLVVDFRGPGGHAGGALMPHRHDAGLAGAELALAVETHVLSTGANDTVGTVGVMHYEPGAINSIARDVHLEIDIRDIDGDRRDTVVEKVRSSAQSIAAHRGVELVNFTTLNQDPPAISDALVIKAAVSSADEVQLDYKLMVSRAYHDSAFMARIAPMAMIFIPCYKGYSHRPDESASKVDMTNGVHVLALTMARLSLH